MRKRILAFCVAVTLLLAFAVPVGATEGYPLPDELPLHAESAILVSLSGDPEYDMVLYAKNPDQVRAPGAMMRYMVLAYALHRIEEKGLDIDTATGTYTIELFNNYVAGTGVATANMAYGEEWTLRDLLTVTFIHNASDAVVVLAEAVDGDVRTFIDGMNTLAMELGCVNSHFYWLSGLDSLSQYTTARDMYRIVRYCHGFSVFEDLASPAEIKVTPVAGGQQRTITTNNHLALSSSTHYYEDLVYSRTGLSEEDGRTCAAVARKTGYEYLVVVMGCPEQNDAGESGLHYRDATALLKWAFKQFEYKTVLGKSEILASVQVDQAWEVDRVNLVPAKEIATVVDVNMQTDQVIRTITVYEEKTVAPIKKGTVYGKVELFVNVDQKIGEVELVASEDISRSELMHGWEDFTTGVSKVLPYVLMGVGALLLLLVIYVIIAVSTNRRRNQQKYPDYNPRGRK